MGTLIVVAVLAVASLGQTALVVPLSDSDAVHAKALHKAMIDAEKEWSDYQETVRTKYLILDKGDPAAGEDRWYGPVTGLSGALGFTTNSILVGSTSLTYHEPTPEEKAETRKEEEARAKERAEEDAKAKRWRKGWRDSTAFQFSDDYRFIVPGYDTPTSGTLHAGGLAAVPCGYWTSPASISSWTQPTFVNP